jgi:hypothetical protein
MWDLFADGKQVNLDGFQAVVDTVLRKENQAFQEVWDLLSGRDRKVLEALASEDVCEPFSRAFAEAHALRPPSSLQRSITRLVTKGLLHRSKSEYSLVDPILKLWLREGSATQS